MSVLAQAAGMALRGAGQVAARGAVAAEGAAAAGGEAGGAAGGASFLSKANNASFTVQNLRQGLQTVEGIGRSPRSILSSPVDDWFPAYQHSIYVAVAGGPDATIERIWQLALSAAFGRFAANASAGWGAANVQCVWDISEKSVAIRINYGTNGLGSWLLGQLDDEKKSAIDIIQRGPLSDTVGGTWADFLQKWSQIQTRGVVARAIGGRMTPVNTESLDEDADTNRDQGFKITGSSESPPVLPDNRRLITSEWKLNPNFQPPRPPEDADRVTADRTTLFAAALMSPCFLPPIPYKTRQLIGGQVPQPVQTGDDIAVREIPWPIQPETQTDMTSKAQEADAEMRSTPSTLAPVDGYNEDDWGQGDF